jgi:hypothetical protein
MHARQRRHHCRQVCRRERTIGPGAMRSRDIREEQVGRVRHRAGPVPGDAGERWHVWRQRLIEADLVFSRRQIFRFREFEKELRGSSGRCFR